MATHKGKEGVVKVGTNVVGEVKSFSLEVTANEVDTSTLGSDWTGTDSTQNSWSGSVDMFYDPADSGQGGIVVGSKVTLELYYEGETSTTDYDTGSALVTSVSRTQSFDGMVEMSFNFRGDGALTTSTVV